MEENTVRASEIEEYEQPEIEDNEVLEESSGSGAFVAGIVGGFLAYAAIGGVKKLVAFAQTKLAERKQKGSVETKIDAENAEISDEQDDSAEETSDEK